ncbi:MAG: hypothetical protein JWP11_132 [Frankiales bacterium]|nr:hypothetical protein [Frankiales bacterium]
MVSADDVSMSLRELAGEAGVSETTLRNWTKLSPRPLTGTRTGRTTLYTWAQLRVFCADHEDLPRARTVQKASTRPPGAAMPADPAHVSAALRNLRAAASSTLDAALSSVRLAEATAASHREQVEALRATISAYDDLITQMTAPANAPR